MSESTGHGILRIELHGMSREAMDTRHPPQHTKTLVPQDLGSSEGEDAPVSTDTPPVACPPSSRWKISCDSDDVFDTLSTGVKRPTLPVEGKDHEDEADLISLVGQALLESADFSCEAAPTEEERGATPTWESQGRSDDAEQGPPTQREAGAGATDDEDGETPSRRAWSPETWDTLVAKAREQRHQEPRPATDVEPTRVRVQRLIEEGFSQIRDGKLEAAWEHWVEAYRLDPENRACRANVRRLAEKLGKQPPSHDD